MNSHDSRLRTDKSSRYMTNTKLNSAFHPSGVGKLSTGYELWRAKYELCRLTILMHWLASYNDNNNLICKAPVCAKKDFSGAGGQN